MNLSAFPLEGQRIAGLHGTVLRDPTTAQEAYKSLSTEQLTTLSRTADGPPFKNNCRYVHYVARKDVVGRANLVFLSFTKNFGPIR